MNMLLYMKTTVTELSQASSIMNPMTIRKELIFFTCTALKY